MTTLFRLTLVLCFLAATAGGQTNTATVAANCRSLVMDVFSGYVPGVGPTYNYVTTYDGTTNFPLYQSLPNGNIFYSQELRPRTGATGVYEADFVTYEMDYNEIDYGSFTGSLATADSDANGLPDVVQKNKGGNSSLTGSVKSDVFGTVYSMTGSVSRSADAPTGTYSISLTTSGRAPVAYDGSVNLLHIGGSMSYSRSSQTADFQVTQSSGNLPGLTLTGSTTFTVQSTDRVSFPQFNIAGDGYTFTVKPFTLTRAGNRYTGNLALADGDPGTYWVDYADWVIEITDPGDSDGDGIPDLSDGGPPPRSQPLNISTRANVQTGDNVMIGGFIVTGSSSKRVIIRAIGPSLGGTGVTNLLANPTLQLHGASGVIASNDNWKENQQAEIEDSKVAPQNDAESAIIAVLSPGAYTAIVAGKDGGAGVGLVEVYDLAQTVDAKLANISTRGLVQTGDNVMIGGFILGGASGNTEIVVRGLGPSLAEGSISNVLANPVLELRDGNGVVVARNDDWAESQQAAIEAKGLAPENSLESALLVTLAAGGYTAIVSGSDGGSGVGLVEAYNVQ